MQDFIILAVLACVLIGVIFYIIREKKRGAKCIGCPYAKQCGGNCGGHNSISEDNTNKDE